MNMPGFSPDPLEVEVLGQGDAQPYRIRFTLPDGSGLDGDLDLAALKNTLATLPYGGEPAQAQAYGQVLFNGLFPGPLANQYSAALAAARGRGIRLSLQLDEARPELHRIPWERMFYPQGSQWAPMAAAPDVVLSRRLQTGHPWALPLQEGSLRVLVVISSPFEPGTEMYVDTAAECKAIQATYDGFPGQVEYDILDGKVTLQALYDRLHQLAKIDILHYIGHGVFKDDEQTGYLVLSKTYDDGTIGPAGASSVDLLQMFSTCAHLPQLIYLGACQSGQQSTLDAFAGMGPQLVAAGCPAVICMQEKVESAVASRFGREFATHLLESGCVDLAVNRARSVLLNNAFYQWAVPVLYMHLVDGILFTPEERFAPAERRPYRFLAPYRSTDRDLFFGRKALITRAVQHLHDYPITVLYGDQGVGLSSLVEAGIRPALESERWLVISLSDFSDLPGEVHVALQRDGHPAILRVAGDAPLADVLQAASSLDNAGQGPCDRLALILDHFEQVFDLGTNQQSVFEALNHSLEVLGDRLRIGIAVHKDTMGPLVTYQSLPESRTGPWIEVLPLALDEAVDAILCPLEALNWPVTLNAALAREKIVPDLADLYGGDGTDVPPGGTWVDPGQLQIVCTWLYDQAISSNHQVDEDLYLKKGGAADGILVQYMNDQLRTAFADQADLAVQVLVAMAAPDQERWVVPEQLTITPGAAPPPAAVQASRSGSPVAASAAPTPISNAQVTQLLDRLAHTELLVRRLKAGRYAYAFANKQVADEAVRLGGKDIVQAYNAGDELERAWRLWLASLAPAGPEKGNADSALATRRQLRMLEEYGQHLDAKPAKLLMLLRSAVLHNSPTTPWLERISKTEEQTGLVRVLEGLQCEADPDSEATGSPNNSKQAGNNHHPAETRFGTASGSAGDDTPEISSAVRELSGRLLGLDAPGIPKRPAGSDGYGHVAWAAANSPSPVDRQTAALALTVLPNGFYVAFHHLRRAFEDAPQDAAGPRKSRRLRGSAFQRKAEVFGTLADESHRKAGGISQYIAHLSWLERAWIYLWRVGRRITWDRSWILWQSLSAGLGAGLGLGVERMLLGWLTQSHTGTIFFALYSYWGFLLAGGTVLAMALTGPLLLEDRRGETRRRVRSAVEMMLGTLGFGLANSIVAALNGINLSRAPLVIPLGYVAGLGIAAALTRQGLGESPAGPQKLPRSRWLAGLRWLLAAAALILVQSLFVLVPELGSGISIAISRLYFQGQLTGLALPGWQAWTQAHPSWSAVLALLEAGLAGAALGGGATVGRTLEVRWYQQWKASLDAASE
jgi:hypothetical protein